VTGARVHLNRRQHAGRVFLLPQHLEEFQFLGVPRTVVTSIWRVTARHSGDRRPTVSA